MKVINRAVFAACLRQTCLGKGDGVQLFVGKGQRQSETDGKYLLFKSECDSHAMYFPK